jgi:hypothetical protein
MSKTRDGVLPRSKIDVRMPPGAATPRSDICEQIGPRGGRTGSKAVSTAGKPLPRTSKPGQGWTLVKPVKGKAPRGRS